MFNCGLVRITLQRRITAGGSEPSRGSLWLGMCPVVPAESGRTGLKGVMEARPCRGVAESEGGGGVEGARVCPGYLTGDSWDPHQDECQGLPNSREDFGWEFTEEVQSFGS